jgi:hypothetical protein
MKILSIRQPWATLIVRGIKDIENRSWATRYRGPLLIHASQGPSATSLDDIARRLGVEFPAFELPRGGIVGVTEIVDCVNSHASPWFEGEFGFVLGASQLITFFPWRGALGLRDAPANLLEALGGFV